MPTTLRLLTLACALAGSINAQLVNLGSALPFAVLGGSAVTNTGTTVLFGSLGVSPGSSITGNPTVVGGSVNVANAVAAQAQLDVTTAYNDAASRTAIPLTGNLGGRVLAPGVYSYTSSAFLTGTLLLDAQGAPDSVWIFQTVSTLITAAISTVAVINGGVACNVFWKVGSSATLGTGTTFIGNILALESITVGTGATNNGGLYARTGAVTLDNNGITHLPCPAPPLLTTTSSTTSATDSSTTSTTTSTPDPGTTTTADSTTTSESTTSSTTTSNTDTSTTSGTTTTADSSTTSTTDSSTASTTMSTTDSTTLSTSVSSTTTLSTTTSSTTSSTTLSTTSSTTSTTTSSTTSSTTLGATLSSKSTTSSRWRTTKGASSSFKSSTTTSSASKSRTTATCTKRPTTKVKSLPCTTTSTTVSSLPCTTTSIMVKMSTKPCTTTTPMICTKGHGLCHKVYQHHVPGVSHPPSEAGSTSTPCTTSVAPTKEPGGHSQPKWDHVAPTAELLTSTRTAEATTWTPTTGHGAHPPPETSVVTAGAAGVAVKLAGLGLWIPGMMVMALL